MKLAELKTLVRAHPDRIVSVSLPDGRLVLAHFHLTEVAHVAKRFVDCGGTLRTNETCLLQLWTGSPKDDGHRLTGERFVHILDLAKPVLGSDDLPVEIEYEDRTISQFPIETIVLDGEELRVRLALKHTDCLAKERCGAADDGGCGEAGSAAKDETESCCAGTSCC